MSYASRWNFWIDIQFQRVSWSSASNSAPPSPAFTAAAKPLVRLGRRLRLVAAARDRGQRTSARIARRASTERAEARRDMPPHIAESAGVRRKLCARLRLRSPRQDMTDPAKSKPAAGRARRAPSTNSRTSRGRARAIRSSRWRARCWRSSWCSTAAHDLRYALSSGAAARAGRGARRRSRADKATATSRTATCASPARPTARARSSSTPRGRGCSRQFFRVLGTGDRLFVHRRENPLPAARAEADVFEGRLIRFDELPFADAIRGYFAKHVTATHFFAPDALLRGAGRRAAGGAAVARRSRRRHGGAGARTRRWRSRSSSPTRCSIGLPRARFATEDATRAPRSTSRGGEVLASRGLVKAAAPPSAGASGLLVGAPPPPARWTFVVRFPAARRAGRAGRAGRHRSHGRDPRRARDDRDPRRRAGGGRATARWSSARRAAAERRAGRRPTSPPCTRSRRS